MIMVMTGCLRFMCKKIEDETKKTSPKLIKSVGYVEQYPKWDDEEDEFKITSVNLAGSL